MKRVKNRGPKAEPMLFKGLLTDETSYGAVPFRMQEPIVEVVIAQKSSSGATKAAIKSSMPRPANNILGSTNEESDQEVFAAEPFHLDFNDHFMANVSVGDIQISKVLARVKSKRFECFECGKCFNYASSLAYHKRTHSGIKPFQCDVCSKRFTDSSNLNAHKRIHRGGKELQCDSCHKIYTQSSQITNASSGKQGRKANFCSDVCGKSSAREKTFNGPFRKNYCSEKLSDVCEKIDQISRINKVLKTVCVDGGNRRIEGGVSIKCNNKTVGRRQPDISVKTEQTEHELYQQRLSGNKRFPISPKLAMRKRVRNT